MTSKVVLTDRIRGALTGQAAAEKLLSTESAVWAKRAGSFRSTQDALSLVVLFDKLLLPIHASDMTDIPILRDAGALEVLHYDLRPTGSTISTMMRSSKAPFMPLNMGRSLRVLPCESRNTLVTGDSLFPVFQVWRRYPSPQKSSSSGLCCPHFQRGCEWL